MTARLALLPFALLTLAPVLLATPSLASEWAIDADHTQVGFKVRHMMVTDVYGAFDKFDAKLLVDDKDLTKSTVNVTLDVNSINTKVAKRDGHLKSPDFFDAATHPTATFVSTKIEKGSKPNLYKVTGNLTIRGTSKPVVLDVELGEVWQDPKEWGGNSHRGVKASGKINRQDFGLKWQTKLDKGGVVVGDDVELLINAEFTEKKPAPAKT